MGYTDWTVEAYEQPNVDKWNELGENDAYLKGRDDVSLHTDTSGEVTALSEKVATSNNDILLIEDSEDSGSKKKIKLSNLPSGRLLFDAVVAPTGGDYTSLSSAIAGLGAGMKSIYIRNGTYTETADITIPSNYTIIGESRDGVIIDFDTNDAKIIAGVRSGVTSAGTITITNGDATITGSSSTFSTDGVQAGDILITDQYGYIGEVLSVTSDTSLELTEDYLGNTVAGLQYDIYNFDTENTEIRNLSIINGAGSYQFYYQTKNGILENIKLQNASTNSLLFADFNCKINGIRIEDANTDSIVAYSVNSLIQNVWVDGCGRYGVYSSTTFMNSTISNVKISNTGSNGFRCYSVACDISDVTIQNANSAGLNIFRGYGSVFSNIISQNNVSGASIFSNSSNPAHDIQLNNISCRNNSTYGFYLNNAVATNYIDSINISNIMCNDNGTYGIASVAVSAHPDRVIINGYITLGNGSSGVSGIASMTNEILANGITS